jgi:hypothetical protein
MQNIITLLLCTVLVLISYYDFRYRALPVYLIVIAVILSILFSIVSNVLSLVFKFSGENLLLLSLQLGLTSLYFSARKRRLTNIFESYLGLGDLVFFLVLVFCFSPLNFIIFIIISGFVTILVYFGANRKALIPLAGCQSLILCVVLLATFISTNIQPYNDLFLAEILPLKLFR